ncbi:hypothetical protein C0995_007892 [Termitomyces sp. Mi166|nr:hypothetical protein C0995_007892 [Termitomyces sp. Mi166\
MPSAQSTDDVEPLQSDGFEETAKRRVPGEESAEHVLKLTKVGRPFHKSNPVSTFTSFRDEAVQTLIKLKFSQSMRTTDPDDPSSFITTTTNFVFSMTQQVAMELCQQFMDARFIRNALDPSLNIFKDRSLHCLTPKGLHVLERFIEKTGIDADHLQPVLESEIICPKLFHVERESVGDSILLPYNSVIALFRWFVGQQPNYTSKNGPNLPPLQQYSKQSKGIALTDVMDRSALLSSRAVQRQHCFDAVDALEWLCNFTSVGGREEAAEVAAHFERIGLITLVGDPEKYNRAIIFTAYRYRDDLDYDLTARTEGEFRCANKTYYQVTDKGLRVAGWNSNTSTQESFTERLSEEIDERNRGVPEKRVTPTNRLHYILKEQSYRSLFRAFLYERYCEEHILYWLDVDAINRKFNVTSSAISGAVTKNFPSSSDTPVKQDRRKHHQALLKKAVRIYKSYLHPNSQFELNTDYTLRNELFRFIDSVPLSPSLINAKKEKGAGSGVDLEERTTRILSCNGEQLQNLLTQFNKIQAYTFRVMLMDSLPKTEEFIALQQQLGDINLRIAGADSALLPGAGGAFFSYSYLVN